MEASSIFKGLTADEVTASRAAHGTNVLTPVKGPSVWRRFIAKFSDPLIIVLLFAGVLSVCISIYEYVGLHESATVFFEPAGIFAAIILATGLGFLLELKADREFAVLNRVNDDEPVQVIRDGGHVTEIPRRDVVVGDIVILGTGVEIPADGVLLEAVSMSVDESSLTGEPVCNKTTIKADMDPDATFPADHVLRGTKVMDGHGVMRVTAVGDSTENGKVFEAVQIDNSVRTPLDNQLDRLGVLITRFSYIVGIAVVVGRIGMYFLREPSWDWMSFGAYSLQTIMIAVTLVVCSVPEGLPMAVTMSLAYSMRRMLRNNNLVRRMHACETMGATTVICTDKTGTLTCNRMQVAEARFYGSTEADVICLGLAANSTAELEEENGTTKVIGNPTEGALLLWLKDNGMDYRTMRAWMHVEAEVPFSTERKYMATQVCDEDGRRMVFIKGAPEIVMKMCTRFPSGVDRKEVEALLLTFQNAGMRTLGFAWMLLQNGENGIVEGRLTGGNLEFLGVVAISDPVRPDVPAAVGRVLDAGIGIKIVTGDTPATAREIGREIGLWTDTDGDNAIITGPELAALSPEELDSRVGDIKIIARARPLDKQKLVESLQRRGEVVAVTGDGTNDAPALKAAQVGLSMGDGTSVAKEASDITIIDNSFASIGNAVKWGRSLYRNIQRFILFQITVNIVACITVLAGAFMGLQSPLTVIQILWVNLIMDTFAAIALASLPPTDSVMAEKPRRASDFIISPAMWRFILGCGLVFSAMLLALLYYMQHSDITSVTALEHLPSIGPMHELSPYELSLFFTIFVFLQFWNLFNARAFATGRSAFHFRGCSEFLMIVGVIFVGQILIVTFGGNCFGVVPLSFVDWVSVIAGTSVVLWIGEIWRAIAKNRK